MKKILFALSLLALCTALAPSAKAWNCSDPLASRVNVGATKPAGASAGDGDGQYYIGGDASNPNDYYVCEVPKPPTTPTGGNSNATSASNSNSTSTANSASQSNSASTSSATGGKSASRSTSTATGGNATGGNATGGNSNSSVSSSGNSNVTNNVNATGGAGGSGGQGGAGGNGGNSSATGGNQAQHQSQSLSNSGNSSSSASGNGVGNGNNSDNSVTTINDQRSVASAYAPSMNATAECFKPYAGGGQGLLFGASFGGGKIDQNCAALEASRQAPSLIARCKIFLTTKYAKEAGVTMEDCMPPLRVTVVTAPPVAVAIPAPAPQPITVNVPVTIIPAPVVAPAPSIVVAAAATHHKAHIPCEPTTVPSGKKGCVVTNGTINK